jgi:hypothetical protein
MSDSDVAMSQPARLALISLSDQPRLDTAQAIDSGPYGIQQIDADEIKNGLVELAAMDPPRVVPKPGGGWRLS